MLMRVTRGLTLLLALAAAGCATQPPGPDPKLAPDLAYIKIVENGPGSKCRYLGDLVSFRMLVSKFGIDVFNVEGTLKEQHDLELRLRAKELGANVIDVKFSQYNGLGYLVQVNTFHAC